MVNRVLGYLVIIGFDTDLYTYFDAFKKSLPVKKIDN
jgi:hypothetical protein